MKLRNWFFLFLAVVFASFGYHRLTARDASKIQVVPRDSTSLLNSSVASAPISKPISTFAIQSVPAKQLTTQPALEINPRYTKKPTEMNVEFEMVNGLAVSYGDTILGQPMNGFSEKNGIAEIQHQKYWSGGVIPFLIKPDVVEVGRIKQAIDFLNQNTNVKFVPFDGQVDAIVFERGPEHCYSYLGRIGGLQPILLSDRCGSQQILHELMHALGFVHEQSRTDRDQYLQVLWENIEEKYQSQFAMVPEPLMESYFGSAFDSKSIMMYEPAAFSKEKDLPTMKLKSGAEIQPVKLNLSQSDIDRVNKLYPMAGR